LRQEDRYGFYGELLQPGTFSIRLTADWDAQLAIFTGEEAGALTVLDESDPLDGEGDAVVILAA
jgi:hypothetical protein